MNEELRNTNPTQKEITMKRKQPINVAITAVITLALASCSTKNTDASEVKAYPHHTCPVTDKKLGSMGEPVSIIHEGQEVKFCCQPCVKKFKTDPEKYLSKL